MLSLTLDPALECGLSTKASVAVGTGMTDDFRLDYIGIVRQPDVLADEARKRSRNGVESIAFACVCADPNRGAITGCSRERPRMAAIPDSSNGAATSLPAVAASTDYAASRDLSVFFLQSQPVLELQRRMQQESLRSNCQTLFGIEDRTSLATTNLGTS